MTESHRNKRFLSRNQVLYRIFPLRCPRWPWNGELITIKFYKSFITCSCHGLGSDLGGVESTTTRAGSQGIMAACYSLKYPHSSWLRWLYSPMTLTMKRTARLFSCLASGTWWREESKTRTNGAKWCWISKAMAHYWCLPQLNLLNQPDIHDHHLLHLLNPSPLQWFTLFYRHPKISNCMQSGSHRTLSKAP